jgi:streptomycin 6-kinase
MSENIARYAHKWKLVDLQPLAQTATSDLYKAQSEHGPVVLKILTERGAEDEKAAADALKHWDGRGAVQLWQHDEGAMLLEYVPGSDLTERVRNGRDDDATAIIADVLRKLHVSLQGDPPESLTLLPRRFQSLFRKAEDDKPLARSSLFMRGATVAHRLLAEEVPSSVLHGDIHHENIRYHPERGWLAIDPKGLYGDRAYDAANALCNPRALPEIVLNPERLSRQADLMAAAINLSRERLLSYVYAHACLSASWSLEDGQDPSLALAVAKMAEAFIHAPSIRQASTAQNHHAPKACSWPVGP